MLGIQTVSFGLVFHSNCHQNGKLNDMVIWAWHFDRENKTWYFIQTFIKGIGMKLQTQFSGIITYHSNGLI